MIQRPAFQKQETSIEPLIAATHWLRSQRATMADPEIRAGANAMAIMTAASTVDGAIEWILREELDRWFQGQHTAADRLVGVARKSAKEKANVAYEEWRNGRLRRAHGLDKNTFFECTGQRLPSLIGQSWEGLVALFELRKLIAHARMARGDVFPSAAHPQPSAVPTAMSIQAEYHSWDRTDPKWECRLSPPLKKAEDYLRKRGIVTTGFLDGRDDRLADVYLTDDIADHFWTVAGAAVRALADQFRYIEDVWVRLSDGTF
jgi:hypothetical protein